MPRMAAHFKRNPTITGIRISDTIGAVRAAQRRSATSSALRCGKSQLSPCEPSDCLSACRKNLASGSTDELSCSCSLSAELSPKRAPPLGIMDSLKFIFEATSCPAFLPQHPPISEQVQHRDRHASGSAGPRLMVKQAPPSGLFVDRSVPPKNPD